MASENSDSTVKTHEEILARIRGLTAGIRDGAAAAEEARTVPRETVDALHRRGSQVMALASTLGSKWCAKSARQTHRTLGASA